MSIYDTIEDGGHNITLVTGMTKLDWCSRRTMDSPLKDKLRALEQADYERLKEI